MRTINIAKTIFVLTPPGQSDQLYFWSMEEAMNGMLAWVQEYHPGKAEKISPFWDQLKILALQGDDTGFFRLWTGEEAGIPIKTGGKHPPASYFDTDLPGGIVCQEIAIPIVVGEDIKFTTHLKTEDGYFPTSFTSIPAAINRSEKLSDTYSVESIEFHCSGSHPNSNYIKLFEFQPGKEEHSTLTIK